MNTDNSKPKSGKRKLVGLFSDPVSLEDAFNKLYEKGYTRHDINLVMSEDVRKKYFSAEVDREAERFRSSAFRSAGIGSFIGGTLGGTFGTIFAAIAGGILLPGIGIAITGPLSIALVSAGAGGLGGGIVGALIGAGIPIYKVRKYLSGIRKGNILLSFKPGSEKDADYFRKEWIATKALEIHG